MWQTSCPATVDLTYGGEHDAQELAMTAVHVTATLQFDTGVHAVQVSAEVPVTPGVLKNEGAHWEHLLSVVVVQLIVPLQSNTPAHATH